MLGNVRLAFGTILENLRKSSESGQKSSENRQKQRHQHVFNEKDITHWLEDMNFMFSWQKQYITRSLLAIFKFKSSCRHVISSM